MSFVAGIDVDTRAVHCVLIDENDEHDEHPPAYHRWQLDGFDAWERTRSVRDAMPGPSFWADVMACGVENPAGRAGTGLYAVQRATGAVLTCLPRTMLVQPWRPAEWRKRVGLAGNCGKGTVYFHARACLHDSGAHYEEWPQDACDAYCLALATRAALDTNTAAA